MAGEGEEVTGSSFNLLDLSRCNKRRGEPSKVPAPLKGEDTKQD